MGGKKKLKQQEGKMPAEVRWNNNDRERESKVRERNEHRYNTWGRDLKNTLNNNITNIITLPHVANNLPCYMYFLNVNIL